MDGWMDGWIAELHSGDGSTDSARVKVTASSGYIGEKEIIREREEEGKEEQQRPSKDKARMQQR